MSVNAGLPLLPLAKGEGQRGDGLVFLRPQNKKGDQADGGEHASCAAEDCGDPINRRGLFNRRVDRAVADANQQIGHEPEQKCIDNADQDEDEI